MLPRTPAAQRCPQDATVGHAAQPYLPEEQDLRPRASYRVTLASSLYSGASKRAYVLEWDGSGWQTTRIGDPSEGELNAPAYLEERIFKNVFAGGWCEAGSEKASCSVQAGYPESVLRVDGRLNVLSGERSAEFYSCYDVL